MTFSEHYKAHVDALTALAEAGDEMAIRSLCCMSMLAQGWRYGDPEGGDGPDDDGGVPLPQNVIPFRVAA